MIGVAKAHEMVVQIRHATVKLRRYTMPEAERTYGLVQYWNDRYTKCVRPPVLE